MKINTAAPMAVRSSGPPNVNVFRMSVRYATGDARFQHRIAGTVMVENGDFR